MLLTMSVFCMIPLALGFAIVVLFSRSRLARQLCLFLVFLSIWQLDVTVLYAANYLSQTTIEFVFRLLRFGPIFLGPLMYASLMSLSKESAAVQSQRSWALGRSNGLLLAYCVWCLFVYAAGWTDLGVERLELVEAAGRPPYYAPVYGPIQWLFALHLVFLLLVFIQSLIITRHHPNARQRSFIRWFALSLAAVYSTELLNLTNSAELVVSSVAIMLFAIIVFVQFSRIHTLRMQEINAELRDKRQMLRNVIDMNPNHIYAINRDGVLTLANRSFAEFNGYSPRQIVGMPVRDVVRSDGLTFDWQMDEWSRDALQSGDASIQSEDIVYTPQGDKRIMQTVKLPVEFSGVPQWLCISVDITERKQYERTIMQMAYHDSLTELPNRLMFRQRLEALLRHGDGRTAGLLFLDLDRFKWVNDTAGHTTGDMLLRQVAERLREACPSDALVCRLGGDEFIVLASPCGAPRAEEIAGKILEALDKPFRLAEQDYRITSSIGIALHPQDGSDVDTLVKHADSAMYEAKERGKNGYMFFNAELSRRLSRKLDIETSLRRAAEAGELSLFYQPQIRLSDGCCIGMEALMRWSHPVLGQVPPSEFIAVAEETGLILPIGRWALEEACRQMGEWRSSGLAPRRIAVNLSLRQLHDPHLTEWISNLLERYGIDPGALELEVTESTAMSDGDLVVLRMRELKRLGVSLSIDDFGTGYASLSHLSQFPLDRLKIDRSFVRELAVGLNREPIVAAIVAMAGHLQLETIAEGVESDAQADFLRMIGCKEAQGHKYSQPLPAEAATEWLTARIAAEQAAAGADPMDAGASA
ncbi:putative bifunctional diguanylate cyclase/phosphodiesterase [Paenibacillus thermoaerophilus]|uniref:Bifunctional diguanylate cyclase/phosphodiesterase n=1 Tax=Paenibacillus thermoaerophilus TaxID=1215385 RepID=A0ABW2V052_9BACL|nr:EAL domain-containing protein [Paenibacillus thermoaerophilus]TMV18214.1 EAL domain-containing protein [Paenibacillus thermoaerophilus]